MAATPTRPAVSYSALRPQRRRAFCPNRLRDAGWPRDEVIALHGVEDAILGLHPGDERQRWLESQALQQATALGAASRSSGGGQRRTAPVALLGHGRDLVGDAAAELRPVWPGHAISFAALFAAALALSMAFKVLLDLNTPFGGTVQTSGFPLRLSDEPLRRALQLITR